MATYSFFFFALVARFPPHFFYISPQNYRQTLIPDIESGKEIDFGVPIMLIAEFMFYVGWFQVGQDLMRPFGLDDE